jgi:uncharacterized RDD family membrane protein YckC
VRYAGFWIRFVAAILDGIVVTVIALVLGAVLAMLVSVSGAVDQLEVILHIFSTLASYVIQWLYEALLTSSARQATLGKMVLGLKVTGLDGQRISFARATGRHFAKYISAIILMIGYIMAAFTERKQALHDMIASTYVVKG